MRYWQLTYTEWDDQKATQRLKWTNYLWDAKKEFGKWSCIRAFQRKGNNIYMVYIYMGIFLYYAYIQMNTYLYLSAQLSMYLSQFIWWIWLMLLILWKLASSNTHRVGQQPRNPGDIFTWWPKAVCRQNSILTRGQSSFMKAFNWLDTAHPHYRVWCFIQFTDLNFSLI